MYKNKKVSVIIAAAGSGKRMGGGLNKQYIKLRDMPVLARSVKIFDEHVSVDEIVITVRKGDEEFCRQQIVTPYGFQKVIKIIAGGSERQDSVRQALKALSPDSGIVLIHDGARPFVSRRVIDDVIANCSDFGAAVPGIKLKDTVKNINKNRHGFAEEGINGFGGAEAEKQTEILTASGTPDRELLRAVQTPQGFLTELITEAYESLIGNPEDVFTDDASLLEAIGRDVIITEGDENNIKITTPADIGIAELIMEKTEDGRGINMNTPVGDININFNDNFIRALPRTGTGFDVHAFAEGRPLILGGVDIPHDRGLLGHSDADVLIHAVMDALLGAAALGDIGRHFPDSDPKYKGISSLRLLQHVGGLLSESAFKIINIDAVVIAQKPKIAPYIEQMRKNMAEVLKISMSQINIKGTTTEKLGFTGREEGIAAQAAASVVMVGDRL